MAEDGVTEEMLDWLRNGMGAADPPQPSDPAAPLPDGADFADPEAAVLVVQPSGSAYPLDAELLPPDSTFAGPP